MEEALYQLGRMAGAQALQLSALVFIVGLSVTLCARNRPHLAFALWLLVLLKCITPPLWSSPAGVFCWTAMLWPHSTEQRPDPAASPTVELTDFGSPRPFQVLAPERHATKRLPPIPENFRPSAQARSSGRATSIGPSREDINQDGPENARPWWLHLILGGVAVWLLGIAAVVGIAVLRVVRYVRSIRSTALAHSAAYEEELAQLAQRLKLRKRIKLVITSSRVGPAVIGLVRPTIVLPEVVVRGKSFADLEPIIAHELIHIRRGDLWFGVLQILCQALWWFHPLVWWTTRLISREVERCCDEEVVGELACIPQTYARSLLDVLELKQTYRAAPVFPGVRPVDITTQRLERIMRLGQGCHRRAPWWCWLITIMGALAALPGAGLSTSAEEGASATGRSVEGSNVVTRIYDVEDVLAVIEEDRGIDRKAAETMLISMVGTTCLGSEDPGDPGCRISKRQLVLSESEGVHQRVANLLDNLRKHGAAELEIQISVARGPAEILAKIVPKGNLVRPHSLATAAKKADAESSEVMPSSSHLNKPLVRTAYQWLAWELVEGRQHHRIASDLQSLGCSVQFSHREWVPVTSPPSYPVATNAGTAVEERSTLPRFMETLGLSTALRRIDSVRLRPQNQQELASALNLVKRLGNVDSVSFYDTGVTESQLASLLRDVDINKLYIEGERLPRTNMAWLDKDSLTWLCVSRTQFSNPAIEDLPLSLRYLDATRTRITDDGLDSFVRLQNLDTLILRRTPTTKEGVEALRSRMPWCDIRWERLK